MERLIKTIFTDGLISSWRILMTALADEERHRSRIGTRASLQGWDAPRVYGRTREQIDEFQTHRQNQQQHGGK